MPLFDSPVTETPFDYPMPNERITPTFKPGPEQWDCFNRCEDQDPDALEEMCRRIPERHWRRLCWESTIGTVLECKLFCHLY